MGNSAKAIIIEIRAGVGGDEAALFAGDLFRMYSRYAQNKNWEVLLLSEHRSEAGGYKEIIFEIKGKMLLKILNMKQVCIECKECLKLKKQVEFILLLQL